MRIKISDNFAKASARMEKTIETRLRRATALALNDVAVKAQSAVREEMKAVFTSPKKFTLNSVWVTWADKGASPDKQLTTVFIRDDYPKTSTSPAKYLLAEELGGTRGNKRSENALLIKGFIPAGVQTTPAGRPISGPQMVQMLSGIGALLERGYSGNASEKTKKRLRQKKAIVSKQTGTPFFLAKSKLDEGWMGIFKLVGPGKIKPMLWFDTKRPRYTPRFHFKATVLASVKQNFARSMQRALKFAFSEK